MPAPQSDVTGLYKALSATKSLQGIRLLISAKKMAREGSPPRVVLFPVEGTIDTAKDITSIRTVQRQFAAHCWGRDFDEACWVQRQLFRALNEQMPTGTQDGAGYYWMSQSEMWTTDEDSSRQGEEVTVLLMVSQQIDPAPPTLGYVESESIAVLTTKLTSAMTSADAVANIVSVEGFSPYGGLVLIDSEQARYLGVDPINVQLVGLVRGVNGTTPASHSSGATVTSS